MCLAKHVQPVLEDGCVLYVCLFVCILLTVL